MLACETGTQSNRPRTPLDTLIRRTIAAKITGVAMPSRFASNGVILGSVKSSIFGFGRLSFTVYSGITPLTALPIDGEPCGRTGPSVKGPGKQGTGVTGQG